MKDQSKTLKQLEGNEIKSIRKISKAEMLFFASKANSLLFGKITL